MAEAGEAVKKAKRNRAVWFGLVAWLVATSVQAAEDEGPADVEATTNSTVITSKHLDFDYTNRTAVFEGDVVVTDPRVKILADTITAVFNTNNAPETVTAVGNVRIEQTDRRATSSRAVYSVKSGLLVLTGKPKVIRGADVMTGSRIIFSRDDDKVKCDNAILKITPGQSGGLDEFIKK